MKNHKVRVGNLVYKVKVIDHPETIQGKEVAGCIFYSESRIHIREDGFSARKMEETWWHEVVHAITAGYGIDLGEHDEDITQQLAVGLHALMMDNGRLPGQAEDSNV